MIETRKKQILDYLTLDYDYHTAKEIGQVLELSSKTIRKEINLLNTSIEGKGAVVESKPGKGFIFKIYDEEKFKEFLKNDWYKYAYYQQESGDKELRYENILRMFLFSNSYIKQTELADMFHVSESQINKDLPLIRQTLKTYHLNLISKPYYGMKIAGSEKNIRLAIKNEIGEDPSLFDNDKDIKLFTKIQEIVNSVDFGQDYYMPYVNFKNLVIHIYISILRIKQGKYIELSKEFEKKVVSYEEFKIANEIVDKLQENLDITIPNQELVYISMHLIAKNTVKDQAKISKDILQLSQDIIDEIYKVARYDFRSNIDFFFALAIHLGPLVNRIKYGFNMKNPILDDIKENKIAFMLATIGSDLINKQFSTKLSDDEIGYIALHIMAAMGEEEIKKKKILIVCGSGNSSAQIMKAQLKKSFGDEIEKLITTDIRNLKNYDLNAYDFIVSSVDLKVKTDTPIILVDIIFTKNDISNINTAFEDESLDEIKIIFNNSIFLKEEIHTKEKVLERIAEIIATKSSVSKKEALRQIKYREKLGFTSYKNVAIPHMLDSIDGDSFSIIIVLKKPISWNNNKVSLIYSLTIGNNLGDMDLYYKKLGDFLSNPKLIDLACKSNNCDEFMNVFYKA
ncbi:MAG: BglG family transcription antiterminator [Peptoniphilaceae bacterium]|nr:BglG family transcription antiterminator [Peptoniphilaceae bacterium]MDY6018097.1 BglG family transcription antiterminator [Anaerococcus sp.]